MAAIESLSASWRPDERHRPDVRHLGRRRGRRPGRHPVRRRSADRPPARLRDVSVPHRPAGAIAGHGLWRQHRGRLPSERLSRRTVRGRGRRDRPTCRSLPDRGGPDRLPWADDPPPAVAETRGDAPGAIHAPDRGAGGDRRADGRHHHRGFPAAGHGGGGEGAPLTPLVHHVLFAHPTRGRAILNLGGIANVTVLPAGADAAAVTGFDTGPANVLLDEFVRTTGLAACGYDAGGRLAAAGTPVPDLLADLLQHPFVRRTPPKSTGRETFGPAFVAEFRERLRQTGASALDGLATLTAFTVQASRREPPVRSSFRRRASEKSW